MLFKLLFGFLATIVASLSLASCDNDVSGPGYAGAGEIVQRYEGFWICTNTEAKEGYAPQGTMMYINASGGVTWQKPNGETATGIFRILNSEWMEVTYAGTTYRAEWWEDSAQGLITFNVNGIRKGTTPFPFDGRFKRQ